jgi:hypothetical protein
MNTPATSQPNPLSLHWNAGSWFGPQLGGTAWLAIAALVLAPHSALSAMVVAGCALAANLVGLALWSKRSRLDPYRALQILVVAIVLASFAATRWLEARDEFALLDPRVTPPTMYLLLAILAAILLALFESKRRAAVKAAA